MVGREENTLYYEDYILQTPEDGQNMKIDYQHFSRLLLSKNKEAVYKYIDSVFEGMHKQNRITPSVFKTAASSWLYK